MTNSTFSSDDFTNFIWKPLFSAIVEIFTSIAVHTAFGKFAFKASPFIFNILACYFGVGYLIITASLELICFNLLTVFFYVLFFYIARTLNKLLKYDSAQSMPMFCLVVYASCCFKIYKVDSNLHEFILTLIVLSVKLLCVTQSDKTFQSVSIGVLIAYFLYHPWISYSAFINLRRKRNRKTAEWYLRMVSSIPLALIFKLLSVDFLVLYDDIFQFSIKPILISVIKGFQCRNLYYFRGQIAEIELLAVGVKAYDWKEHLIFDLQEVEFAILIKTVMKKINKPLAEFFDGFNNKDDKMVSALILFLIIIGCNSIQYLALFLLFLGNLFWQEHAVAAMERFIDICLFTCSTPFCYHRFGRRYFRFHYFKTIFVFHNQFRMSLLFVNSNMVYSSVKCLVFLAAIDVGIIVFCRKKIKQRFRYFSLSNRNDIILT